MHQQQLGVGRVGLEGLMSRAHIIFSSGYLFRGRLRIECLERAFREVTGSVHKFHYRLRFEEQNRFHWEPHGPFRNQFLVREYADLEQGFKAVCADCFDLQRDSNHAAMLMAVIRRPGGEENERQEFIIAQLSDHTYTDAGSSEVIFQRIIDHYNAQLNGDEGELDRILVATRRMRTLDAREMVEKLGDEDFDHQRNVEHLRHYLVADVGDHKVPLQHIPGHLDDYLQRVREPIIHYYDIRALVSRCRRAHPEVTKNSAVSAVLAKAVHQLNVAEKGQTKGHVVSFKMLSNILPGEMRQHYSGNYIAFVPVTVDGDRPVEEMALDIHRRIREFRDAKIDLSLFHLVEDAVDQSAVGGADEELSFIVTNWNNYTFIRNPDYLAGCRLLRHVSGVNIEPKDTLGGSLVNRPVMVISLSPEDELCLSFFPSLRSDEESRSIVRHIDRLFEQLHED